MCFQCQQEMRTEPAAAGDVKRRVLQPRDAAAQATQRPLTPTATVKTPPRTPSRVAPTTEPTTVPPARPRLSLQSVLGVSLRQRAQFYRQFQSLLRSGIPLSLSLNYVQANVAVVLRSALRDMFEFCQRGGTLSDAMARHPGLFPEWEVSVVQASQQTGALPEAMRDIAQTLELEQDLRLRINASTLSIKITAVVFLFVMVLLAGLRGVGEGGLGAVLGVLSNTSVLVVVGLGLAIGLWQLWRAFGRTRVGGAIIQTIATGTPMIGPVLRNMMRLRFTRVLGALWNAGISPTQAIETAARASGNPFMVRRAAEQIHALGMGGGLADALIAMRIYPQEAIYLIQTGESSGTVGDALMHVAEYLEMDLQAQTKTLPVKLQFIFFIIMAIAVGILMISFYTQYFSSLLSIGE
jgi:type IV pilus assembly protein PilC